MLSGRILQYQLTERIGGGGMGVVWKALDTRLDREVALKFLSDAATSDPSRRERFFREAKAASALNHPNIITIYEINADGGQLFIAMELVRGWALSDVLLDRQQLPLPPAVSLDYAVQLCEGLGAAHRAGIVHREIKPSNIMVTQDGMIKILDFGLAKLRAPESEAAGRPAGLAAPLTVSGVVVGTIPYMSPEQAVGEPVGPRSDVFSFGLVLYEMLSGRKPFQGSSNAEIMRVLLSTDPSPILPVAAVLPEPLARIAHKCLEKNPDARYADAGEVAEQLRTLEVRSWPRPLFDLTTVTTTAHVRVPGTIQKRRRLVAGAAVLVLAVALLAGYAWWPFGQATIPSQPRAVALAPAEALQHAQAYLQRYDRKGNVERAIATLEPALQRNSSNAALHAALAEAYLRKYAETSDRRWLQMGMESGRQAVASNDDLAAAHVALGMALAASGQNSAAAGQFERARDLNPLSGPAHLGLARLRSAREAEQFYQKAIQYSPGEWVPPHALATFYYNDARYDESVAAWRQALLLAPDNVLLMSYLGGALHMKGQYAEAADTFQRALALDATTPSIWANLGTVRYFQGSYLDAVRAMEKAAELAPGRFMYWGNLGDSYRWAEGLKGKAGEAYEKAIRLVRERLAVTPGDPRLRSSLAAYLAKSGDATGALAELAQLEQLRQGDQGTLFKSALVYELVGDRDKALAALGRAIRAGYSMHEIANEPELAALRADPRYASMARPAAAGKKR